MSNNHAPTEAHEHKSHKKMYIWIFVLLAVLTAIEIWVAEIHGISAFNKGTALTLLALGKAFLVAYFYMHLNEETKWLKLIAAVPILAGIYAIVLGLESYFKPF